MDQPEQIHFLNEAIRQVTSGISGIMPELVLLAGIIVLLLLDMLRAGSKAVHLVTLTVIIGAGCYIFAQFELTIDTYFAGNITVSPLAVFLKLSFLLALAFTTTLFGSHTVERPALKHTLLLATVLGANIMVSANNYLTLFVAIELVSVASYLLVGISGTKQGYEASIKYLLFGAMTTAILLYGISLIYGATGSLHYTTLATPSTLLALGSATMIILVFSFKMGLAPMHLWLPDVYEATPAPVVAFLSYVPKLAGLGLLTVWLQKVGLWDSAYIAHLLALLTLASIVIGTFSAIWQQSPKRLIAYSSIAQSGFLLLGAASSSDFGIRAFAFFAIVYLVMNYLAFYLIEVMEQRQMSQINHYSGKAFKLPTVAIALVVVMISLTGLPPTAGFTGKLLLLSAFYMALDGALHWVTFIVAIFSAIVGLFFYLKIPYFMIFKKESTADMHIAPLSHYEKAVIGTLSFILVFLFLKSDILLNFINSRIFVP